MDFDFKEDSKPRFQLQSGNGAAWSPNERTVYGVQAWFCATVGVVLLGFGWSFIGLWQWLALWVGASLVVGPFAPSSVTGGDCSFASGQLLLSDEDSEESFTPVGRGKHTPRMREVRKEGVVSEAREPQIAASKLDNGELNLKSGSQQQSREPDMSSNFQKITGEAEDREWTPDEIELLKKLIQKHPRGTLRRWEVISEALGGKHNVGDVVKMSKICGQKKTGDQDSYARFLDDKKGVNTTIASPLSQRDSEDTPASKKTEDDKDAISSETPFVYRDMDGKKKWTEVEDKALLTALKTFPKDSSMRWDKVAFAVPGRSKAQCFARFSDLRKDFRMANGVDLAVVNPPLHDCR